jgi:hypothetical protein
MTASKPRHGAVVGKKGFGVAIDLGRGGRQQTEREQSECPVCYYQQILRGADSAATEARV